MVSMGQTATPGLLGLPDQHVSAHLVQNDDTHVDGQGAHVRLDALVSDK